MPPKRKPAPRKKVHWSGSQMICPWFSREEGLAICCRGEGSGFRLRMAFDRAEGKKQWASTHCETYEYWRCPLCEMLDEWAGITED